MSQTFKNKVQDEYFEWLYDIVSKQRAHEDISYRKLFMLLHDIEFTFVIPNDVNRAKDGIDLRYKFSIYNDYDPYMINRDILDGPCSVLEMMVALAIRCEEAIMYDTTYGDRTGQWFWGMLNNLGLGHMIDSKFNERVAKHKIYDFLDREYFPDGRGGLFWINDCEEDLRNVEIWTQLCWYLNEIA